MRDCELKLAMEINTTSYAVFETQEFTLIFEKKQFSQSFDKKKPVSYFFFFLFFSELVVFTEFQH